MRTLCVLAVAVLFALHAIGAEPAPVASAPVPPRDIGIANASTALAPSVAIGAKSVVTDTMAVASHFDTTDCGAWGFQVNCMHWGTDYSGSAGDPVFAPFDLTIIALGEYGPGPTMGQYVQGTFADGAVFYAGHLTNRPTMDVGQTLPAGTRIGSMNEYAHTHVQLGPPGNSGACAQDGSCLDFEQYYQEH